MKMLFLTLILGICLLSKANTLNCYECTPVIFGTCTGTKTQCPSETNQCVVTRMSTFVDGKTVDAQSKGCSVDKICGEASVNYGTIKTVIKSKCCTGELCNNYNIPDDKPTLNGKKCFSCTGQDCTRTLNCEGNEDHCIKATMNLGGYSQTFKGCASELICSDQVAKQLNQFKGAELSCCQGNYCNSAISASADLLLLLVSLIFLIWFY